MPSVKLALPLLAFGFFAGVFGPAWAGEHDNLVARPFEWSAVPSDEAVAKAWPRQTVSAGSQKYTCTIGADGRLLDCSPNWYDDNAPIIERGIRSLLRDYRVTSVTTEGLHTAGLQVVVTMKFGPDRSGPDAAGTVYTYVPWAVEPDDATFLKAYPAGATDKMKVAFTCRVGAEGGLADCEDVSPSAATPVQRKLARTLLPFYRAPTATALGLRTEGLSLDVPIELEAPGVLPMLRSYTPPPQPPRDIPAALAQRDGPSSPTTRTVLADLPTTLLRYFDVGDDCTASMLKATVTEPPAHGQVLFENDLKKFYPGRVKEGDPRRACLPAELSGKRMIYAPDPGYVGADRLVVRFDNAGHGAEETVAINVVQP